MKHIKKFENTESTYEIKEFYINSKFRDGRDIMLLYINGQYYTHGYFDEYQNIREYIEGFYSCMDFLKVKYNKEEIDVDKKHFDNIEQLLYNEDEPELNEIESIINAGEMGLM